MRRLGGILFLVLLTACGTTGRQTTVVAVSSTAEPTTTSSSTSTSSMSTSTSTSTTSTSSTTSTTVARTTTTGAPVTALATTVPLTRLVPATTTTTSAAPAGACDPNYAGACVPIDSDVDCGGGTGNGPSYVYAKNFRVVGRDIYGLDGNNDGIACQT